MVDDDDYDDDAPLDKTLTGFFREDGVKNELAAVLQKKGKRVHYDSPQQGYVSSPQKHSSPGQPQQQQGDAGSPSLGDLRPRVPTELDDYNNVPSQSDINNINNTNNTNNTAQYQANIQSQSPSQPSAQYSYQQAAHGGQSNSPQTQSYNAPGSAPGSANTPPISMSQAQAGTAQPGGATQASYAANGNNNSNANGNGNVTSNDSESQYVTR